MYIVKTTKRFERDLKRCRQKGLDIELLRATVSILAEEGCLPAEYSPHVLTGEYAGFWECHIEDDWLLIWKQNDRQLTLLFTDTGTHEELFGKK